MFDNSPHVNTEETNAMFREVYVEVPYMSSCTVIGKSCNGQKSYFSNNVICRKNTK